MRSGDRSYELHAAAAVPGEVTEESSQVMGSGAVGSRLGLSKEKQEESCMLSLGVVLKN